MGTRSRGKRNPDEIKNPLKGGELPLFVVYARKSTDESSEKQVASIPQQIEKCLEYSKKENIPLAPRPDSEKIDPKTIEEIELDNISNTERCNELKSFYIQYWVITERASAKEPYKRDKWRYIIDGIRNGSVRGILSYSPDRISRNLLEGGELIQLVDTSYVALKFTNFHFENNAGGQMMLGFWFVFAEHYSKKLSEDVLRGSEKKHLEGYAIGTRKFGYDVDKKTDRFIPDEKHFPILKKAFERKLHDNWSDSKIADEMNKAGWDQVLKESKGQNKQITDRKISNYGLWSEPFYYGLYIRTFNSTEVKIDLRTINDPNYEFVPLITEDEFFQLQEKLSNKHLSAVKKRSSLRGEKLKFIKPVPTGMIFSGSEDYPMTFMLPNPKRFENKADKLNKGIEDVVDPHQIRYRVSNTKADIKVKEIKWETIDNEIANFLKTIKVNNEDYQAYLFALKEELDNKLLIKESESQRLNLLLNKERSRHNRFLKNTSYGVSLASKKKELWDIEDRNYEDRINKFSKALNEIQKDSKAEILEKQEFVNSIENLHRFWKKATYVQKHDLLEEICLNIIIYSEKRLTINMKPAIADMFIKSGGQGRN